MNFNQFNFHPAIANAIQFDKPTPIQAQAIPAILAGKDIFASAETGSGKTAAFVLPTLQHLAMQASCGKPRALILTPTRELATQISQQVERLGARALNLASINIVGGEPYPAQLRKLAQALDIVVATPGRLLDHLKNRKVDLSMITLLILDEADRMLDMGFIDDVKKITRSISTKHQTLLFSATVDNALKPIVQELLNNPVHINLSEQKMMPKQIEQLIYWADDLTHKRKLLQHIVSSQAIFKAIIFSETKREADLLADELYANGYAAMAIHGDLKQNARNRRLEQFRRNKIQFLIATDVAARGLDVNDITHVINYGLPRLDSYVHRIGRTGRAGKEGTAISLALIEDIHYAKKIERYIGQQLKVATVEGLEPKKQTTNVKRNAASRAPKFKKDFQKSFKKNSSRAKKPFLQAKKKSAVK